MGRAGWGGPGHLGTAETWIYVWRRKRQIKGTLAEADRLKEADVARLKQDLAQLEEEMFS